MKIYLIRHGESIMNTRENDSIGEIDSKVWLTENGKDQAQRSAKFLKAIFNYFKYAISILKPAHTILSSQLNF